ncbi:carbohydrate ABC transporter permease [Actinomadura sp. HBU206391]|uniref:carbohydrate ABC transporter permease n=1 Tax=Actinomadura sp. HBU206391 TaxID=2731692 RepID=UPI00165019C3|nr:carbohydrate ABC transporter permease [Actinomadura sp. HBU206391]MBC6459790.1 carbohydrate ABC transporter permease [Actinomadura sp. HBU206391]
MTSGRTERIFNYTVLSVFSVFALFPLVAVAAQALHLPDLDLSTFGEAWRQGHFGTYMRNSLAVAVGVVLVATVLSIMSGYALGTMDFPGANALFYLFLAGLMIPSETVVVPLYFDLRSLHLDNTLPGLMLPQIAQSVAFGTFWMRAYFRSVPRSLIEAARMDGASSWSTLWRILVPVGRPAILTMVVLTAMWTWNEFLLALVIINSDEGLRTAPLGLSFFQGQHQTDYPLLMAGALIVAAPVVIVYVFLQRHFIAGMLSGAIKE